MTPTHANPIPNIITGLRLIAGVIMFLILAGAAPQGVPFLSEYLSPDDQFRFGRTAFVIFVVAASSDWVDGYLARRWHATTRWGAILDPIADKLLLSTCFFGLWWSGLLPGWLVAVVLLRDIVILVGARAWWRHEGRFRAEPSGLGKATTLAQLLLVALVLARPAGLAMFPDWIPPLALATTAITVVSGIDYVVRYGRRALAQRQDGDGR